MKLRIAIWSGGGALVGLLDPLHLRKVISSTWDWADSGLSDLSHCAGSPLRPQFLFRPAYQCRCLRVGRFGRGNQAAPLQTPPDFKRTHYLIT
jgi:hypothetical protein